MPNFPEFLGCVIVDAIKFDSRRIALRLVGNDFAGFRSFQVDRNSQAAVSPRLARNVFIVHVDQRLFLIQFFDSAVAGNRIALHKAQLAEPHPSANRHSKCAGNNFGV